MDAVFDSNIIIDYLLALPQAQIEINRYSGISISLITWMEVMAGARPQHEDATHTVLKRFVCLPISKAVANRAFVLRRDRRLKLPDAIILATAQEAGLLLVTRNSRDFSRSDPQIRFPYQV